MRDKDETAPFRLADSFAPTHVQSVCVPTISFRFGSAAEAVSSRGVCCCAKVCLDEVEKFSDIYGKSFPWCDPYTPKVYITSSPLSRQSAEMLPAKGRIILLRTTPTDFSKPNVNVYSTGPMLTLRSVKLLEQIQ